MRWWVMSLVVALLIVAVVVILFAVPKRKTGYEYKPAGEKPSAPLVALPGGEDSTVDATGSPPSGGGVAESELEETEDTQGEVSAGGNSGNGEVAEEPEVEGGEAETDNGKGDTEDAEKSEEEEKWFIPASRLSAEAGPPVYAFFQTTRGNFLIAIYPEIAPISARHFIDLVEAGFYNGISIHRYEPNFVVQMGRVTDPNSPKFKFTQETIADEPNISENAPYTVAFAKSYKGSEKLPNSASTQFFINLGVNPHLDNDFTVMGQVIHGADVVTKLRVGDLIGTAEIVKAPDLPK